MPGKWKVKHCPNDCDVVPKWHYIVQKPSQVIGGEFWGTWEACIKWLIANRVL